MLRFLRSLFGKDQSRQTMRPLYDTIIALGREPDWYIRGGVKDDLDGRFHMISAILSAVLIRLEAEAETAQNQVWLTEIFVDDMDGQLRQLGIGDMVVGKHIGKMMGALGGQLGTYRSALTGDDALSSALSKNLYQGQDVAAEKLAMVDGALAGFFADLQFRETQKILEGNLPPLLFKDAAFKEVKASEND